MTISDTSMNIARILVKLNNMNTNTSMSIARILVLNSMNRGSMSIAHIPVRLNNINDDIGSRGVPFVCRGRQRYWWWRCCCWWWYKVDNEWRRKSSEQLTMNMLGCSVTWLAWKTTRRGSWEQSREERFPNNLFILSWCRITRTRVLKICSPDHRCTQELGMERLFILSRCRITRTRVLKICSPDHRCTQELGMERLGGSAAAKRGKNPILCCDHDLKRGHAPTRQGEASESTHAPSISPPHTKLE
jgi:hypothetical protein